ncbi:hypothetical protein, partial [Paracraurococcus lichenis]
NFSVETIDPMGTRRCSRENVALVAQLLVLAPQAGKFLAFGRVQSSLGGRRLCLTPTLLPIGGEEAADRVARGDGRRVGLQTAHIAQAEAADEPIPIGY